MSEVRLALDGFRDGWHFAVPAVFPSTRYDHWFNRGANLRLVLQRRGLFR